MGDYTDIANATNAAFFMNKNYGVAYDGYGTNGSKYRVSVQQSVQQNTNGAYLNFEVIE